MWLALIIAAAAGWVIDAVTGPVGRIVAAAVLGAICIGIAVAGWSLDSVLLAVAAIVGFNAALIARALIRYRAARQEMRQDDVKTAESVKSTVR